MVGCVGWMLARGGMRNGGGGRAAKCLEVCPENVRLPERNTWFCHQPIGSPTKLTQYHPARTSNLFFPWDLFFRNTHSVSVYVYGSVGPRCLPDIPSHMRRSLSLIQSGSYNCMSSELIYVSTQVTNILYGSCSARSSPHSPFRSSILHHDHTDIEGTRPSCRPSVSGGVPVLSGSLA